MLKIVNDPCGRIQCYVELYWGPLWWVLVYAGILMLLALAVVGLGRGLDAYDRHRSFMDGDEDVEPDHPHLIYRFDDHERLIDPGPKKS